MKTQPLTQVFAIAGATEEQWAAYSIQPPFRGDTILLSYYWLPSTLVFQSAFIPGLTSNEYPAIANTCSGGNRPSAIIGKAT